MIMATIGTGPPEWLSKIGTQGSAPFLILPEVNDRHWDKNGFLWVDEPNDRRWVGDLLQALLPLLVKASTLRVDGPFRDILDNSSHPVIPKVFHLLWEARFLYSEGYENVGSGIYGEVTSYIEAQKRQQQVAIIVFLLSLATQNDLLRGAVLAVRGLDEKAGKRALENYRILFSEVRRWSLLVPCPFGIIVEFPRGKAQLAAIRRLNLSLALEIENDQHRIPE